MSKTEKDESPELRERDKVSSHREAAKEKKSCLEITQRGSKLPKVSLGRLDQSSNGEKGFRHLEKN